MKLICGDCLEEMKKIPDEYIDLIVTDPPYKLTARGSSGTMGGYWKGQKAKQGTVFNNNDIEIKDYIYEYKQQLKNEIKSSNNLNEKDLQHITNLREDLFQAMLIGSIKLDNKSVEDLYNFMNYQDEEIERLNNGIDKAIHYINLNQDSKSLCLNYEQLKALRGILRQDEFYLRLFEEQLKELKGSDEE